MMESQALEADVDSDPLQLTKQINAVQQAEAWAAMTGHQRMIESMPYVVAAWPDMAVFPDVTSLAVTMALSAGLKDRSAPFYETVISNFAMVMGTLIQAGIIVPAPTSFGGLNG